MSRFITGTERRAHMRRLIANSRMTNDLQRECEHYTAEILNTGQLHCPECDLRFYAGLLEPNPDQLDLQLLPALLQKQAN